MGAALAKIVSGLVVAVFATAAGAETVGFDHDPVGAMPAGWVCGSTDGGAPLWTVEADGSAPSPPNVLKQSGSGSFPWCVKQGTALADGVVEVKVTPLAGYDAAPVTANAWHTLRVEFKGVSIRVLLDGKLHIEFDDSHIAGPGAVGVWTSADSVTAFDDFHYQPAP